MIKKVVYFICLVFISFALAAQEEVNITGTVTDANSGVTLPGVNIVVAGTTTGAVTDLNGAFSITATQGATLSFSFISYLEETVVVGTQTIIDVKLIPDITQMEEVVVVGYGKMNKSDLTGSVTSVSVNNVTESGVTSVNQLLQGRAAGVDVMTNSGVPGGNVTVTIRGVGSMSASTQPLYVIDGIVMDGTDSDITDREMTPTNPMAFLSSDDIESIEILKDASATAIYGSRGANGVILISTKKGVKGGMKFDYSGNVTFTRVAKKMDVMDGPTFARYQNDIAKLDGDSLLPFDGRDEDHPLPDSVLWVDWQDETYGTGFSQKHRISLSGGDDVSRVFASFGYNDGTGIIESTGFKKYDFRTNYSRKLSDRVNFGTNVSGSYLETDMTTGPDKFGGKKTMVGQILGSNPLVGDYVDEDGELDPDQLEENNPIAWMDNYMDQTREYATVLKFNLDIKLLDWLSFKSRAGINYRMKERSRYWGRGLNQGNVSGGRLTINNWSNYHYVLDNLLFVKKRIGKHKVNGTLGITYDHKLNQTRSIYAEGFIDDIAGIDAPHASAYNLLSGSSKVPVTYASALFRINYVYDKISTTITGRADGSSKLSPGRQWGFFPSAAVAYRLHKEDFIKNIGSISNLKIRVGWGQVGNSSNSPYSTVDHHNYTLATDDLNNPVVLLSAGSRGFEALTWEKSQQTNVGVDFGLWRNRLTLTVDAYRKVTKDQLQTLSLPASAGFGSTWTNEGEVENKGFEVEANGVLADGNFKASIGGNFALNRNKILKLKFAPDDFGRAYYVGKQIGLSSDTKSFINVFMEGQPVGAFFGYKTDGIIQDSVEAAEAPLFYGARLEEGNIKFVDVRNRESDTVANVNVDDMSVIGNPNADFIYGFNGSIGYKNLTLDFQFNGVFGRDIYNVTAGRLENHLSSSRNKSTKSYTEAWTPENPSNTYPRLDFQASTWAPIFTDRWVEDASYLRLSHITLSYIQPIKKVPLIDKMKLYATASNLFTITKYSGNNPESNSFSWDFKRRGLDFNSFPVVRSFIFGINVTFK